MATCPQCRNRLPLRALLSSVMVCPHCYSELQVEPWTSFWILAAGMTVLWGLVELLRPAIGKGWAFAIALVVYLAATAALNARFARFRLKKPPVSILRP